MLTLFVVSLLAAPPAQPAGRPVSVQILSATAKDKVVPGAQVILQKDGQPSQTGTTDDKGQLIISSAFAVDDATVSLIVKKEGFSPLVVQCPCNGMSYAVSERLKQIEEFRVVLNWSNSPADLDLHVIYPGNHVFFQSKNGTDAFLDVDDTDGFGPETITIKKRHQGEKYAFAVHNYSAMQQYGTSTLSNSQAKVFVYVGESLLRSYYVKPQKPGALWVLFAVDENGSIRDLDTVIDVPETKKVVTYLTQLTDRADFGVSMRTSSVDAEAATTFVERGDTAMKAGETDKAIEQYQKAIERNPTFGPAYVSLVKAYQKAQRPAEAEWARRRGDDLGKAPVNGYRVPNERIAVTASTTLKNWKVYTFAGANLIDDNLWTSWQPTTKPSGGVGDWVKLTFTAPQKVSAFEVSNGFRRIDDLGDLYTMNNRVKTGTLEFSDGTTLPIEFKDEAKETTFVLPEPKSCTWVKLTVDTIYKGSKWNDLAISELHPLSKE